MEKALTESTTVGTVANDIDLLGERSLRRQFYKGTAPAVGLRKKGIVKWRCLTIIRSIAVHHRDQDNIETSQRYFTPYHAAWLSVS